MEKHQKEVDQWFKDHKWEYWQPLEILARLMEETGEFARLVNHLHGAKKKRSEETEQDLEEEMGDIIYTLICYANANGLDLDQAVRKSLIKVERRDERRYEKEA